MIFISAHPGELTGSRQHESIVVLVNGNLARATSSQQQTTTSRYSTNLKRLAVECKCSRYLRPSDFDCQYHTACSKPFGQIYTCMLLAV